MGYLADIVADARDRHCAPLDPAFFEAAAELSVPGESGTSPINADSRQPETPFAPTPHNTVTVDRAEADRPDIQPTREGAPKPRSTNVIPDAAPQVSAEQSLHEHLRHLSQQTLVERSEKILTRQQSPVAPSMAKAGEGSASEQQQQPSPDGHKNASNPASGTATDTSRDSSGRPAVQPVYDSQSAQRPGVTPTDIQADIQAVQEHDTRTAQDTRDQQRRRHLDQDAAKNNSRDRQIPLTPPEAVTRTPEPATPSRQPRESSSAAPQLRIGQINVVVESTRPDQHSRSGLERGSESGSRYFLRSL
jgi:hypothetical protein